MQTRSVWIWGGRGCCMYLIGGKEFGSWATNACREPERLMYHFGFVCFPTLHVLFRAARKESRCVSLSCRRWDGGADFKEQKLSDYKQNVIGVTWVNQVPGGRNSALFEATNLTSWTRSFEHLCKRVPGGCSSAFAKEKILRDWQGWSSNCAEGCWELSTFEKHKEQF